MVIFLYRWKRLLTIFRKDNCLFPLIRANSDVRYIDHVICHNSSICTTVERLNSPVFKKCIVHIFYKKLVKWNSWSCPSTRSDNIKRNTYTFTRYHEWPRDASVVRYFVFVVTERTKWMVDLLYRIRGDRSGPVVGHDWLM